MDNTHFHALISSLLPKPPAAIAVAVSGGVDSMGLALLLADWCKKQKVKLVALTVDHGLRPEAKKEAATVHKVLSQRGIEHHILTHKGKKPAAGLMEHARELRYKLLAGWCKENNIKHLAVAHHRDDQAETFLMRLARGSGVDGLGCMAPVSEQHGLILLRPLLDTPKEELVTYLKKKKVAWIEDPTNRNTDHTRNRLRQAVESCFAPDEKILLEQRLAATATTMRRVQAALDDYTAIALAECVEYQADGSALFDREAWRDYPPEIRLRVLAEVLKTIGQATKPLRFEKLERLHQALLSDARIATTLAACKLEQKAGKFRIMQEAARVRSLP